MLARRKNAESRSVDLLPPACLRVLQENPRESLGGQPRNIVRAVEAMRGPFRVQSQTFVQLHERASFPAECGDEGFGADVAPIAGPLVRLQKGGEGVGTARSEERRVGRESVSQGRYRGV